MYESLSQIPRNERPEIEELEDYELRYDDVQPDYTQYRTELRSWLSDYWRDQERKRQDEQQRTPLLGHEGGEDISSQRYGYDRDEFLKDAAGKLKARPMLH